MFKKLLIASSLLVSLNVAATTITESGSFGVQGSVTDQGIGQLNETVSIAAFDTSLGNLTGVDITVFGQLDSAGSSENQSAANGRADVSISLFQDWKVETSVADDFVFVAADFVTPFLMDESSAPGNFDLATGDVFEYAASSGEISSALGNVDLAAFTTGSPVDFIFSAFANTAINNAVDSGIGTFANTFSTAAWGQVEVTYTFEEVMVTPTPVSAPGSIALLGLTLTGLAFARKKKQS